MRPLPRWRLLWTLLWSAGNAELWPAIRALQDARLKFKLVKQKFIDLVRAGRPDCDAIGTRGGYWVAYNSAEPS